MIVLNAVFVVFPIAGGLFFLGRRNDGDRRFTTSIVFAAMCGMGAVVPLVLAGSLLSLLRPYVPTLLMGFIQAFVFAGLLEESMKLGVTYVLFSHRDDIPDGVSYLRHAVALSLGFALLESLFYLSSPPATVLMRNLSAVPIHVAATGLGAVAHAFSRSGRQRPYPGLIVAVLVHGSYNFLLELSRNAPSLGILAILLVVVACGALAFFWSRLEGHDAS